MRLILNTKGVGGLVTAVGALSALQVSALYLSVTDIHVTSLASVAAIAIPLRLPIDGIVDIVQRKIQTIERLTNTALSSPLLAEAGIIQKITSGLISSAFPECMDVTLDELFRCTGVSIHFWCFDTSTGKMVCIDHTNEPDMLLYEAVLAATARPGLSAGTNTHPDLVDSALYVGSAIGPGVERTSDCVCIDAPLTGTGCPDSIPVVASSAVADPISQLYRCLAYATGYVFDYKVEDPRNLMLEAMNNTLGNLPLD